MTVRQGAARRSRTHFETTSMQTTATKPDGRQRSFFGRLADRIRAKLRQLFGKKDDPNIYPFF